MKLTKNLVVIASSTWTWYFIQKKLYVNFRNDMTYLPSPLFAYVRILMDHPPPKCEHNN